MVPSAAPQHSGRKFHQAVGIGRATKTLPLAENDAKMVLINRLIWETETPTMASPAEGQDTSDSRIAPSGKTKLGRQHANATGQDLDRQLQYAANDDGPAKGATGGMK